MSVYFIAPDILFFGSPMASLTAAKRVVITGARADEWATSGNETVQDFETEFVNPVTPDVLVIARAHYLPIAASATITVTGAMDSGFTMGLISQSVVLTDTSTLKGYDGTDLLMDLSLEPRRFWRIRLALADASIMRVSKIYLSRKFHMGREPVEGSRIMHEVTPRLRRQPRNIELKYEGIHVDKFREFQRTILNYRSTNPVFLWAKDDQTVTNGEELIHAVIGDVQVTARTLDKYDFSMRVKELI